MVARDPKLYGRGTVVLNFGQAKPHQILRFFVSATLLVRRIEQNVDNSTN